MSFNVAFPRHCNCYFILGKKNVKCVDSFILFRGERIHTYQIELESPLTPDIRALSAPFPSSFYLSLRVLLTFLKLSVP